MQLGWVGYCSIRSDLMAPRQAPGQHYALIPALAERIGDKIHWLGVKHLIKGCEMPQVHATEDEIRCHQNVYHYSDSFAPMVQWVNKLPVRDRWEASVKDHFDVTQLRYGIPQLDVCIVQATGQIGGAWSVDYLLRLLYARNPNIGFILHDQDQCSSTTLAKMKKWHPNWQEHCIVTTNYLGRLSKFKSQVPALSPHLTTKRLPPSPEGEGICYVGNDYQRRERMYQFLGHPGCNLYGAINPREPTEKQALNENWYGISGPAFIKLLQDRGCVYHGPFKPGIDWTIEDCYHRYAAGVCLTREDSYRLNCFGCRPTEVARAGKFAFWDNKLAIGFPLGGEAAAVSSASEMMARLDYFRANPQYWVDCINYQWDALAYYTSVERYTETFYRCALRLMKGPVNDGFELNLYKDLMEASGLRPWGTPNAIA